MVGTADIVKYGMIAAGVFVMVSSFLYHSCRKLTVNLAVVWEIFGAILIATGVFPVLSTWAHHISRGTGMALFIVGAVCLWELAMQVSLLLQENERIMRQLEEKADGMRENEEKDSVRD